MKSMRAMRSIQNGSFQVKSREIPAIQECIPCSAIVSCSLELRAIILFRLELKLLNGPEISTINRGSCTCTCTPFCYDTNVHLKFVRIFQPKEIIIIFLQQNSFLFQISITIEDDNKVAI